jgi:hypothetical protein
VRPAGTVDDDLADETAPADRLFDRRGTETFPVLLSLLFAGIISARKRSVDVGFADVAMAKLLQRKRIRRVSYSRL